MSIFEWPFYTGFTVTQKDPKEKKQYKENWGNIRTKIKTTRGISQKSFRKKLGGDVLEKMLYSLYYCSMAPQMQHCFWQ